MSAPVRCNLNSVMQTRPSKHSQQTVSLVRGKEDFDSMPDKHSRLEIIDGTAHATMMEKPYYKVFRNKVLDFFSAN